MPQMAPLFDLVDGPQPIESHALGRQFVEVAEYGFGT